MPQGQLGAGRHALYERCGGSPWTELPAINDSLSEKGAIEL